VKQVENTGELEKIFEDYYKLKAFYEKILEIHAKFDRLMIAKHNIISLNFSTLFELFNAMALELKLYLNHLMQWLSSSNFI